MGSSQFRPDLCRWALQLPGPQTLYRVLTCAHLQPPLEPAPPSPTTPTSPRIERWVCLGSVVGSCHCGGDR